MNERNAGAVWPIRRNLRRLETGSVFVLVLVCAFAVCSLFVILFGARVYKGVRVRANENFAVRTGLAYLRGKLRASDADGMIRAEGNQLCIVEGDESAAFETYIFLKQGELREATLFRFAGDESEPDLENAVSDTILEASDFAVVRNNGVYVLTVQTADGTFYTCKVAVRSAVGGGET